MSTACGCGDEEPRNDEGELEEREPERLWEVSELRFAAASGVFLVAGFIAMTRASARLRTTCLWTCESGGTSITTSPRSCAWQERRRPGSNPRFSP